MLVLYTRSVQLKFWFISYKLGVPNIDRSGVELDFGTKIWMAYNDWTSPQTCNIRIVIRHLEVRYLVYYQFTI